MPSTVISHSPASPRADFGDVKAEFWALLSACGVYSLSGRAKIAISGGDRVRWLNGMVTNNVRDLPPQHGVYAFLLNPQGHILGDLFAYNRGDSWLADTDQSQLSRMLEHFDHYIIMDDVVVTDTSDQLTAIGLAGPKAPEALQSAGIQMAELEPLQLADLTWQGVELTAVRGDNPSVPSFELWLAPASAGNLWQALVNGGAKPVGDTALDWLRIASGIPRYGQDIRERDLPQETGQARALNFSKGCYVGQEIVERIRSRGNLHRSFSGFVVEGSLPARGTKLQADGKDIGELTSIASLALAEGEIQVGLGYIRREAALPGRTVRADAAEVTVELLPFRKIFKH
jgi:folate-binding protein YgfZ